jgi:hypothetical protein
MRCFPSRVLLIAIISCCIVACGGGGGGGGSSNTPPAAQTPQNSSPSASAGVSQTVDEQTTVTISGSGTDSDGSIASYSWTQTQGTSVTLSGTSTAQITFTAPALTASDTLTFRLTVTDDDGATDTDSVSITINPVNASPVADAGADQTVTEQTTVTLAGSGADSDGAVGSFTWAQTSGINVTLSGADSATTNFTAPDVDTDEILVFELTVSDDEGATNSDTIEITVTPPANLAPTANSLSLSADPSIPFIEQNLIATDPDGDTIVYELVSDEVGTGYTLAYVNPDSGMFYLTIAADYTGALDILYRVSDGQLFSDTAHVMITVEDTATDYYLGAEDIDPRTYAGFEIVSFGGELLGRENDDAVPPPMVDLSPNFPGAGNQGQQGSCVGWAVAWALKSYQERIENSWSLNTGDHLFSPSFVFNQIQLGNCNDAYINEALQLIVDQGSATWSSMPYDPISCSAQPTAETRLEAANLGAYRKARVDSILGAKGALANRLPVVVGIRIYEQLSSLDGPDSVYNTATGPDLGGHAVTVVGYDDNRYGGAFHVINSWGRSWGDDGFFWLPYSFASQVIGEAWVLEDLDNGAPPNPAAPTTPAPVGDLPNLRVETWSAQWDPIPRGQGTLEWSVINTGLGTAPSGANVNLMLSKDQNIRSNDVYVVYEDIPYDIEPGGRVYRDSANTIPFAFPDSLLAGTYYMALWVDDLQEVAESDETDNISPAQDLVTITNTKPDLYVRSWYTEWDNLGNGTLTYDVQNIGASAASSGWYINLVFSPDELLGNGNEIFLFFETAPFSVEPGGGRIFRDEQNSIPFSIYTDFYGSDVPDGIYYMALWLDDLNQVDESNELNNYSFGGGTVTIGSASASSRMLQQLGEKPTTSAYNGKVLRKPNQLIRKVRITNLPDGGRHLEFLDKNTEPSGLPVDKRIFMKTNHAKDTVIFPVNNRERMPK